MNDDTLQEVRDLFASVYLKGVDDGARHRDYMISVSNDATDKLRAILEDIG